MRRWKSEGGARRHHVHHDNKRCRKGAGGARVSHSIIGDSPSQSETPVPFPSPLRTDQGNPHTTADASYTCTHKGMCNKLWNVMWHDHGNFEEYLQGLYSFQRYSHLPGLSFFARKVRSRGKEGRGEGAGRGTGRRGTGRRARAGAVCFRFLAFLA